MLQLFPLVYQSSKAPLIVISFDLLLTKKLSSLFGLDGGPFQGWWCSSQALVENLLCGLLVDVMPTVKTSAYSLSYSLWRRTQEAAKWTRWVMGRQLTTWGEIRLGGGGRKSKNTRKKQKNVTLKRDPHKIWYEVLNSVEQGFTEVLIFLSTLISLPVPAPEELFHSMVLPLLCFRNWPGQNKKTC